jgi:hypothetical protein
VRGKVPGPADHTIVTHVSRAIHRGLTLNQR